MKLTQRSILLLTGILVALLICLTFFITNQAMPSNQTKAPLLKKIPPSAPTVIMKKVAQELLLR